MRIVGMHLVYLKAQATMRCLIVKLFNSYTFEYDQTFGMAVDQV